MPGFFAVKNIPFKRREKVSLAVWTGATFSLLIPTCLKLSPLGNDKDTAQSELDLAQDEYNKAVNEFNKATASLTEAEQRIVDLDCAMAGYLDFNQRMDEFQQSLNNTVGTSNKLGLIWDINWAADTTTQERYVTGKSWDETNWEYDYYYSCTHSCSSDKSCCYGWGYRYVTKTYYYNEITEITNKYKNIGEGSGVEVSPLNCGYYSRIFKTLPPQTYQTYQSPSVNSGDRRAGTTYVTFTREFGSKIPQYFQLDDTHSSSAAIVLREPSQAVAANDLSTKLAQFLAASLAAFNTIGIGYPALQQGIRDSLPELAESVHQANETVQETALVLYHKQQTFAHANEEFHQGLSLWLPLFFLVPGGLALLTYFLMTYYKPVPAANTATNDMELGAVRETNTQEPSPDVPPPAYEEQFAATYNM